MSIFFVIFAAILLIAVIVGLRELRTQGFPRGSAQLDFGPDGDSDLRAHVADHSIHCDHDGGHCDFGGGDGHH
jgi:hypothetical protein